MIQLLYCTAGAAGAEVFTFATRLTRLTPVLDQDAARLSRYSGQLQSHAPALNFQARRPRSAQRSRTSTTTTGAAAWPGARSW